MLRIVTSRQAVVFKAAFFKNMSNNRGVKRSFQNMVGRATGMIDHSDFERINSEMSEYDQKRENVIKRSRDIQKLAKNAIFSIHRSDDPRAAKQIEDALAIVAELMPVITENSTLRPGSFSNSLEELCEAQIFRGYLLESRLLKQGEMGFQAEADEYLGGVLDFTGELNRLAIAKATVRDVEAVTRARDLTEGLMGSFLQFDFRNGNLRKKYDSLKYVLKNLENTLYELSLTSAGFRPSSAVAKEDAPAGEGKEGEPDQ